VSRNPLHAKLISIIEPVLNGSGYELVDLRFVLEQIGWVLRVQVDGVDIAACENLSRELSAVLDVEDPIPQAYSLEVSSPGIDRPLRTEKHFAEATGSEAKVALAVPMHLPTGERRNFKGVLRGVADGRVAIECDGQKFELPIADIDSAKIVPDWDAVMHKQKRKQDRG
jgi:ribosome maturation factor RimP